MGLPCLLGWFLGLGCLPPTEFFSKEVASGPCLSLATSPQLAKKDPTLAGAAPGPGGTHWPVLCKAVNTSFWFSISKSSVILTLVF